MSVNISLLTFLLLVKSFETQLYINIVSKTGLYDHVYRIILSSRAGRKFEVLEEFIKLTNKSFLLYLPKYLFLDKDI